MLERLGIEVPLRSWLGEWSDLWKGSLRESLRAFHASPLAGRLPSLHAVVVNGEGTIHHGHGRHLLTILAGAQELGLRTHLVNAVFQACDTFGPTLKRLDDLTVRDARSSEYLASLGVPHRLVLDSILEADFVEEPTVDFGGRTVVTDWHAVRDEDCGGLLRGLMAELGDRAAYYPLESPSSAAEWRSAVANLRTAGLVVTGRHHGVYLAAMAGVPFVALGSNTWKVEGLLDLLPGRLRVCRSARELGEARRRALSDAGLFEEIRRCLESARPLPTFEPLAGAGEGSGAGGPVLETTPEWTFAGQLAEFFGARSVLHVDFGPDGAVRLLARRGEGEVGAWRTLYPSGRTPVLPFGDGAFDAVSNLGSLASLDDGALSGWVSELARVAGSELWIAVPTSPSRPAEHWASLFGEAGCEPHPRCEELGLGRPDARASGTATLVLRKGTAGSGRVGQGGRRTDRGLVCLATNYLLMTEPTRAMWEELGLRLADHGVRLVLLSTNPADRPLPFPVHAHPYLMREFATAYPGLGCGEGLGASARELEWLRADMSRVAAGYSLESALEGLVRFRGWARAMLEILEPGFALLADNTLCQTALLQRWWGDAGVPVWISERGLLPETLMIESRGIQAWSDLRTHWLAGKGRLGAAASGRYGEARDYYRTRRPEKYVQAAYGGGGGDIRRRLDLGGRRLVVFLGGGYEANGHAPRGGRYERHYYSGFPTTQEALMGLWRAVEQRSDTALVFKPHPLDPDPYAVARIEGVEVMRDVNVHALIDAADVVAAQYTTLQFEAALYDKPVLLLARSAWWGRGATYEVDEPTRLPEMLDAALSGRDWPAIRAEAQAFLEEILDGYLIGCHSEVPARRNLEDLAAFIARTGIDSRALPPAEERCRHLAGWLSACRPSAHS